MKKYGYGIVNPEMVKHNKNNRDEAKQRFVSLLESDGYSLVSEYKSKRIKVVLRCPEGHEYSILTAAFRKGDRCPNCKLKKLRIKKKQELVEQLNKEGYELVSEYYKARSKVTLKCDKGHEYEVRPNDFKNGHRCPQCQGSTG